MFRKFWPLLLLIAKCFTLEGASSENFTDKDSPEWKKQGHFADKNFYIEALPGYYYPTEKRIRDVYGTGGFNGQLDIGYFLHRYVACFLRGGAYWADGESTALKNNTSIVLGNITLGLKFILPLSSYVQAYIGAGGRIFFLRIKNDSDFVQKHISKNKFGGAAVTGFWIYPSKRYPVFLDVFLDYSFYRFNLKPTIASKTDNLDVSGPTVGIGLGYLF